MLAHCLVALMTQLGGRALTQSWWAGAFAASAWALSREITQAEYRWIEAYGGGLRANMPWWGSLDARVWNKVDPWADWLAPTALVLAIASAKQGNARPGQ